MQNSGADRSLFWSLLLGVVVVDLATKSLAVRFLSPIPQPVVGDLLHWQLVFNRGAAFGLDVGPAGRWILAGLSGLALVGLGFVVRSTRPADHRRLIPLALVCGGTVGNLLDRIRNARGVIDFIDVELFGWRLPTFNLADVAVVGGVTLLSRVLLQRDHAEEPRAGTS